MNTATANKEDISEEKMQKEMDTYERKFAKVQEAEILTQTTYWRQQFDTRKKRVNKAHKDIKKHWSSKVEDIETKDDLKDFKAALANLEKQVEELHSFTNDVVTDVRELYRFVFEMPLFKEFMKLTAEWNATDGKIEFKDNK